MSDPWQRRRGAAADAPQSPARAVAVAQPARVVAVHAQSPGLCVAAGFRRDALASARSRSSCRTTGRSSRATTASWYLPDRSTIRPRRTFGGDFPTPTDWLDPLIARAVREARQLGGVHAQPLSAQTRSTTSRSAPNPAPPGRASTGSAPTSAGATCSRGCSTAFGVSILFALALTAIGTRARHRSPARCRATSAAASTSAAQRLIEIWSAMPELYLLIIFASIFAPSLLLLLILLSPLRLDRPVGLRARRVPAQPQRSSSCKAARAMGLSNWQIIRRHVLPNSHDAGDHLPAVPDERARSWPDRARLPRPRRAARLPSLGELLRAGQGQPRRLVDLVADVRACSC